MIAPSPGAPKASAPATCPNRDFHNLALRFHEVATNAAKYGALFVGDGHGRMNADPTQPSSALNASWSKG
ncbi:two-component sensor histidine kinase [Rhizobium sp. BK049]|nr:two-component sensor histidine kinase [Rhizobium sp. BK049]